MAEELGWEVEAFDKAFQEVFAQGMVKADFKARLVWLPKAVIHNKPESPNVVRGWRTELAMLPECALKAEALEALRAHLEMVGNPYAAAFFSLFGDAALPPEKALPKPSAKPLRKTMPNQEQEQEQEQEHTPRARARGHIHSPAGSGGAVCVSGADATADILATIAAGMRGEGVADAQPSATMRTLVDKGAEPAQFNAAARMAAACGKGCTYALAIVRNQLREAAAIQAGPAPVPKAWDHDRRSIEAKGAELGLGAWDEAAFHTGRGEAFTAYTQRVRVLVEQQGQPA
jgi:hypothetical protein